MNFLYCGDKNIEDGLVISILSLLKNVEEQLNIYVFTITFKNEKFDIKGILDDTIEYIDKKVKEKNKKSFVKKIDITNLFKQDMLEANMETRFTPCCMLRLYADLVDEIPDRILYLDYDVVCRKNFEEFYNQDMEDFEIAGVLDYYGKWVFRNKKIKQNYINSGVLLLNLSKIRETGLFKKAREMCKNKKMFMPDQSAINKTAMFKKIVPRKYNEQGKLKQDTVFQHFSTNLRFFPWFHTFTVKPWQINEVHEKLKIYEYDDILEIYTNEFKKIKVEREKVIVDV